jgi:hypothetical protein
MCFEVTIRIIGQKSFSVFDQQEPLEKTSRGLPYIKLLEKINRIIEAALLNPGNQLLLGKFKLFIDGSPPEVIEGKFIFRPYRTNKCNVCHLCIENVTFSCYKIINVFNGKVIEFEELNLHAINIHNNYNYPGKWSLHRLSPRLAAQVLDL